MLRVMLPPLRKPVRVELFDDASGDAATPARRALMQEIMDLNPSASAEFLEQFEDSALRTYLDHLNAARQPRGRDARWIRPHGKPWAFAAAACA